MVCNLLQFLFFPVEIKISNIEREVIDIHDEDKQLKSNFNHEEVCGHGVDNSIRLK